MPALPLDEAGKYVAAAYVVFFTLIVLYIAIISAKFARIDRELTELVELAERDEGSTAGPQGDPLADEATEPPRDGEPVA
jgi:hypothetical protein